MTVGVHVEQIAPGREVWATRNPDVPLRSASAAKVLALVAAAQAFEDGALAPDARLRRADAGIVTAPGGVVVAYACLVDWEESPGAGDADADDPGVHEAGVHEAMQTMADLGRTIRARLGA